MPWGFWCVWWLHLSWCQCLRSKLVAKVVGFGAHCPNLHWSTWMRLRPRACSKFRSHPIAQILEHLCAEGELEHCAGSSGCSRKEAGGDAPCLFAPSSSWERVKITKKQKEAVVVRVHLVLVWEFWEAPCVGAAFYSWAHLQSLWYGPALLLDRECHRVLWRSSDWGVDVSQSNCRASLSGSSLVHGQSLSRSWLGESLVVQVGWGSDLSFTKVECWVGVASWLRVTSGRSTSGWAVLGCLLLCWKTGGSARRVCFWPRSGVKDPCGLCQFCGWCFQKGGATRFELGRPPWHWSGWWVPYTVAGTLVPEQEISAELQSFGSLFAQFLGQLFPFEDLGRFSFLVLFSFGPLRLERRPRGPRFTLTFVVVVGWSFRLPGGLVWFGESFIDLPLPEEGVHHGFLQGGPFIHPVVDVSPGIPFCV